MCGLFGFHKGHKIVTPQELRNLNDSMVKNTRTYLSKNVELDVLKQCNTAKEYVEKKLGAFFIEAKKSVMATYEVSLKGNGHFVKEKV